MTRPFPLILRLALAALALALTTLPARAGDLADARATLAKSVSVVEKVRLDQNFQKTFDPLLAEARAILVVPSFYKGAFFIGGAYGNGVLTVRDDDGTFSPPLFMRMIGGSFGLQFGGQEGQLIFLVMTSNGLNAILEDKFKVGANVGVSVGTFGANMEAATTSNMNKDIIVFGHARGAFGGGAIEGAGIEARPEWNRAVYGDSATPKAVLFDRRWTLPEADALLASLSRTPVELMSGPAAQDGDAPAPASAAAADPAPAPAPAPSYSASGQTGGTAAPAPPSTPSASAPVRLVPVERQDLQ